MRTEQFLFTISAIIALCSLGYFLVPVYAEYKTAKAEEEKLEQQLILLEYEYSQVQQEIHALKSNPKAVERVAREKFGWCREDEKIYHFDPPSAIVPEKKSAGGNPETN